MQNKGHAARLRQKRGGQSAKPANGTAKTVQRAESIEVKMT
jgi:hypothetical protein